MWQKPCYLYCTCPRACWVEDEYDWTTKPARHFTSVDFRSYCSVVLFKRKYHCEKIHHNMCHCAEDYSCGKIPHQMRKKPCKDEAWALNHLPCTARKLSHAKMWCWIDITLERLKTSVSCCFYLSEGFGLYRKARHRSILTQISWPTSLVEQGPDKGAQERIYVVRISKP